MKLRLHDYTDSVVCSEVGQIEARRSAIVSSGHSPDLQPGAAAHRNH